MKSCKSENNNTLITGLIGVASNLDPTGVSGSILDSIKLASSIRDNIYLSKFQKFWSAPEENDIKVDRFIKKTKEQEDWEKVGENFLLVIDNFSAFDKCYYYGKVWIAWLEKEINTNEFCIMIDILQLISPSILNKLIYNKDISSFDMDFLTTWGIFKYSGGFSDPNQDESIVIQNIDNRFTSIGKKLINSIRRLP
jgi:hypothetical protein